MAVGTSKGKLVEALVDQINHLKQQNTQCASASKDTGYGRVWMLGASFPDGVRPDSERSDGWNGDTDDVSGIKKAFDRSEIANTFNDVMDTKNPGTGADRMAMKFQSDYLAAMGRAFRTRHAGLVRCELFSSNRRQLQGAANLENSAITYTQNIIGRGSH